MADVYLATDVGLERAVALKVMLPELMERQDFAARFQREARTIASLHHPNIVQIYTTGTTPGGEPYLAMQYLLDGTLQTRLETLAQQQVTLQPAAALQLVQQVAKALVVAHRAGVVHRDLKPSNILLHDGLTPIVTDFGIAAIETTTRLTRTDQLVGTPHYMSPEQIKGERVDGRSDLYSLGVILYELLTGQVPFMADSPIAVLHHHVYEAPPPLKTLRPGLDLLTYRVVNRCLHKEPNGRFATAADLVAALDAAIRVEKETTKVPRLNQAPALAKPKLTWPWLLIPAALVLVVMGLYLLRPAAPDAVPAITLPTNEPAVAAATATTNPTATIAPTTALHNETAVSATAVSASPLDLPPTTAPPTAVLPTPLPVVLADVTAVHFPQPPLIDGDLGEWGQIVPVQSAYLVYQDPTWDGTQDISAMWRLGWDEANLYISVVVGDDRHVQEQTGNQIFRGDSVDFQIDTNRQGDYSPGLSPDDFQITFSPGNFTTLAPSAFRFVGTTTGRMVDAPGHRVTVAARSAIGGYTLEAAIPWGDLAVTPASGLVLGIALNVTDNDYPGTAVQELYLSHIATRLFADPTSWGTLTLE